MFTSLKPFVVKQIERNYVFLDWQNLYLGTTRWEDSWKIDFKKFSRYLKDKYSVVQAYYFIWYEIDANKKLYRNLLEAGFTVIFKWQTQELVTTKKWNIDSDLIFYVMKKLIDDVTNFDKILIVSWDGDFGTLVEYLIEKRRFKKILFPDKKFASSLYKHLWSEWYDYLQNVRKYIEYIPNKQKKGS